VAGLTEDSVSGGASCTNPAWWRPSGDQIWTRSKMGGLSGGHVGRFEEGRHDRKVSEGGASGL
jgi:hypothetical protein